jgi:hypothetical protein
MRLESGKSYQLFVARAGFKASAELVVALRILICKNIIIYEQNHLSIEQLVLNKDRIDEKDR